MKNIEFNSMEHLIKQPYRLTMGGTTYNRQEGRILTRCIQAIQPIVSEKNKEFLIKNVKIDGSQPSFSGNGLGKAKINEAGDLEISLVAKSLLASSSDSRQVLRKALKGLTKKSLHLKHKDEEGRVYKEIIVNLASRVIFNYRSEKVYIKIDSEVIPYLVDLTQGYTRYLAEFSFKAISNSTAKIYEVIAHFRDKKQANVKLSELKRVLGIEDKYRKPAHIKQRILEPAMRELKEKADVWFDIVERVMDGRKMVGWKFNIYTKKKPKTTTLQKNKNEVEEGNLEQKLLFERQKMAKRQKELADLEDKVKDKKFKEKLASEHSLSPKQVEKLIAFASKNSWVAVFRTLEYVKKMNPENIGAYTVKMVKEKLGLQL